MPKVFGPITGRGAEVAYQDYDATYAMYDDYRFLSQDRKSL